jgi:hypothetical protein
MSKPTSFGLTRAAMDTMSAHRASLKRLIFFIVPALVALDGILFALQGMGVTEKQAMLFMLPKFFLYAVFALRWHRVCLSGEEVVNPYADLVSSKKFILYSLGLSFALTILLGILGSASYVLAAQKNAFAVLGAFGILVLMAVAIVAFIRVSFLLPAQSVGVSLSVKEAWASSRGLVKPLLGANIIFFLLFSIVMMVYMMVVGIVVYIGSSGKEPDDGQMAAISVFLSIPAHIAGLAVAAACVGVLSKAYQWGMGNNSVKSE